MGSSYGSLLPTWGRRETSAPPEGLMAKLLDRYGIAYRSESGQFVVNCPLPGHDDRRPSCSLHMDKGLYHCQSCGRAGGIYQFIEEMEGVDREAARRITAELSGGPVLQVSEDSRPGGSLLPGWASPAAGGGGLLPAWARARCPA